MADIKLDIGGGVAPVSGTVELNIDWSALGSAFANAGSEDQADFLDAVQTGFGDYASIKSELMQMTNIADAVRAEARFALRKWLIRMATALDSPGESAPAPKKYETLGDIAEEVRRMQADGMTVESVTYAITRVYAVNHG